ncbi:MAG: cation-translocating P-type ATPase, partial [Candidatus Thalassarchaeaceae archaeon]|nr:cation-translocating P-type ATPase [Candidatus Thalassarchaeaceae archaeon]
MEDEDFLLLDDDEEPVSSIPANKSSSEKIINLDSKDILSGISKTVENSIIKFKESNELKKILDDGKENLISFSRSADSLFDADLVIDGNYEIEWEIDGMDCADCAMKATRAVNRLPGIHKVSVSVTEGNVRFNLDMAKGRVSRVNSVLESLGHNPKIAWKSVSGLTPGRAASNLGIDRNTLRHALLDVPGIINVRLEDGQIELQMIEFNSLKLQEISDERISQLLGEDMKLELSNSSKLRPDQVQLLSAVFTIPLLLGVIAIEDIPSIPNNVGLLLAVIGISFAGLPMLRKAAASIRNRVLGFQVLTSLAVIGAMIMQEYAEALVVTGLVALASHLEEIALVRARNAMQGGLDRLPRLARLSSDDDWVPVQALSVGDIIEIRSGEVIPVDGLIIEGSGAIDRAPLTGEPIPIGISEGDSVEAGLVLVRGPIVVKCEAIGDSTRLASLIDLVRNFREMPTKTQTTIERFTALWVPFVLVGSLAYGLVTKDYVTTLVLWVVSCPCSLLLAAPVPHATALSAASASGLVARGGDVLESAASIELALLDKTGTLTTGHPKIGEFVCNADQDKDTILAIVSALEKRSNHPYARAIISMAEESDIKSKRVTGIKDGDAGVYGKLSGKELIFGRVDWLKSQNVVISDEVQKALDSAKKKGHGVSVLSLDGKSVAAFTFIHDDARDGVKEMVQTLQKEGIIVEILSGDEQSSVESFAKQLGIDPDICRGNVDPEGKAQWVIDRSKARRTLMAGDGFNDAGALAAANIGVAVGSGDQVNLEAADVLIPGDDPRAIVRLIQLAKRTKMIVNVNIAISVLVTLI